MQELEYQAEVAEWVGADVINIHGGGAYGDKQKALADFARNLDRLSSTSQKPADRRERRQDLHARRSAAGLHRPTGIPLVYDVHHHRCNPDGLSVEQATKKALATWNREPMFHISSPIEGWDGPKPERHHDFIDVKDFPKCWRRKKITVEVEAKAKEVAVEKLLTELKKRAVGRNLVRLSPAVCRRLALHRNHAMTCPADWSSTTPERHHVTPAAACPLSWSTRRHRPAAAWP